jgi:manganese transport protein
MIVSGGIIFLILLVTAIVYPLLKKKPKPVSLQIHKDVAPIYDVELPSYKRIAVALDFSERDQALIANAMRQANNSAAIILIHIVESASAKVYGEETDDFESRKDQEKLDDYVGFLQRKGFTAESRLGFRNRNKEIPKLVKEANADLLIIGAHGHSGVKDWLYGATIDAVRHRLQIPVLIVHL